MSAWKTHWVANTWTSTVEGAFAWCMKTTGETLISPAERVEAAPRAGGGVAGAVADNEYPSNATPARWRDPALRRYLPAPCCRRRRPQTITANPAASYTIARSGSGAPEMRVFDGTASDSYPRTLILRNQESAPRASAGSSKHSNRPRRARLWFESSTVDAPTDGHRSFSMSPGRLPTFIDALVDGVVLLLHLWGPRLGDRFVRSGVDRQLGTRLPTLTLTLQARGSA